MIAIVTQLDTDIYPIREYVVSTGRPVVQVSSEEDAMVLVCQSEDDAPIATFVADFEELGELLFTLESWPEINVLILLDTVSSERTLADCLGYKWKMSSPTDLLPNRC